MNTTIECHPWRQTGLKKNKIGFSYYIRLNRVLGLHIDVTLQIVDKLRLNNEVTKWLVDEKKNMLHKSSMQKKK